MKHNNTQPLYIFNRENPQNSEPQNGPRSGLDYIALANVYVGLTKVHVFDTFEKINDQFRFISDYYNWIAIWILCDIELEIKSPEFAKF